jgi:peptide/nickel transport system ATP-binding protein
MNSLNPVMRVKDQIIDSMKDHSLGLSQQEMERRMYQVLERVDLRREVARMYPHQLSGGMKQRVCVAIAICMQPDIIIADEPTSALDVVVQRQVMETIGRLQKELGVAVILIGHDMGLMAQFVDRLAVMYRGRLVEIGPVREVFKDPLHPYTQLLIGSLPSLEHKGAYQGGRGQLAALQQISMREIPALREVRPGRWVALPAS